MNIQKAELVQLVNRAGLSAALFSDLGNIYIHESNEKPADEIHDVMDDGFMSFVSKPSEGLWLSTAIKKNNTYFSDWRSYCCEFQYGSYDREICYVPILSQDAVILTLTDENYIKVPILFGEDELYADPDMLKFNSFAYILNKYSIPWVKLKELGIDMVHVNGRTQRSFFYGWDCDSSIVLNGKIIEGWEETKAFIPENYTAVLK